MAKNSLNKSFLHKKRVQLSLYKKVLPSLELKRRQLMVELTKAKKLYEYEEANYQIFIKEVGEDIPMLANEKINHSSLLKIKDVEMGIENIVGIKLPFLKGIFFEKEDYSILGKQPWSEMFISRYKKGLTIDIERAILKNRIILLEKALKKTTQKVNLFEKVLIPEALQTIKRIQIVLDDMQRASVVRSKIAKSKQSRAGSWR